MPVTKTRKKMTTRRRKVKNPLPVSHNFKVVPPAQPGLESCITSFKWDLYKKTFSMRIQENATMDAFTWIQGMSNTYDQARIDPMMAVHDMVNVTILNQNDEEVALYRFAKLVLTHHECELSKHCSDSLSHYITVSFERCEKDQ